MEVVWKDVKDVVEDLDPSTVPQRALKHRSLQYQERLEELRAEARGLPQNYGDQFLDEAFRGGTSGVRAVSVVAKRKSTLCEAPCTTSQGVATQR